MEIEYQNKNTITWCLEREGPLICLKATMFGEELESIEIKSENFSLEFEFPTSGLKTRLTGPQSGFLH